MIKGMGWKPDLPDHRDYPVSKMRLGAPLQGVVSMRRTMSPVRDQGMLGACTGFAVTAAMELLRRTDADDHSTIYSPLFAYLHARIADGEAYREIDAGAYIRDAIKVVANIGVPPESRWKYDINRFAETPTRAAQDDARRWKAGPYYRCGGLSDVKRAISMGHPVVGGFSVFANVGGADRTGLIPMPAGTLLGGHAVCFMGFDDVNQVLEFKNSWGPKWGDAGYGWLPYSFVDIGYADDLWVITAESPATRQDRDL